MNILFYRYNSICEPAIIAVMKSFGINVIEEKAEMNNKQITPAQCVELVSKNIQIHHPVFVFSINFYPAIAEVCHLFHTLYLCWTVDSPVPELFSVSLEYDTNRIFLFDRAQYEYFHRFNPGCIHYLPLASHIDHFNNITSSISAKDFSVFSTDISFVGSLYNEKNPLHGLNLSNHAKGYVDALVEASLKILGYNPTEEAMTESLASEIKSLSEEFFSLEKTITNPDQYIAAHSYVGMQIAETERIRTLNTLAQFFKVDLFTRSDTSKLQGVHVHGGVDSLTEMPKIFHLSKINLNMTIKPIQTGLPLRIFDILGCGGFLMTNYQSELPEYFQIGVDLEAYSSMEELVDKCAFYLEHENERQKIALNGYQKVCESHTYTHRLKDMLKLV